MSKNSKIQVYFDGACYLCAYEISLYRKLDRDQKIDFVDISLDSFDPKSEGLDPIRVNKFFHVRKHDSSLAVGVEGFIAIWEELKSLNFLARWARFKPVRIVLELGYKVFVVVRPYLPRRKCDSGSCQI